MSGCYDMCRARMTLYCVVFLLLEGCASHRPFIPRIERPLTADEAAQVLAMADMIDEAGPQWGAHSNKVRTLLSIGRIGVGRLPNNRDAWATTSPRLTTIILRPGFFTLPEIDQAGLLVHEACHILRGNEDTCDAAYFDWQADWFAAQR